LRERLHGPAGNGRRFQVRGLAQIPVLKFDNGREQVRQAYFMPISREALDIVLKAGGDRAWPDWIAHRPSGNSRSKSAAVESSLSALEGLAKEVTILTRKRSGALRNAALAKANGICEACEMNFFELMNGAGARVLQVHHKMQLSLTSVPQKTELQDLAVLLV